MHEILLCTSVSFIGQPIIHSGKLLIWLYYLWCYNAVSSVGTKCKKNSKIEVGDFFNGNGLLWTYYILQKIWKKSGIWLLLPLVKFVLRPQNLERDWSFRRAMQWQVRTLNLPPTGTWLHVKFWTGLPPNLGGLPFIEKQ